MTTGKLTMMIQTTEGLREAGSGQLLEGATLKTAGDFLKRNCCTAGFSVQYAHNPATDELVEVFKQGRLVQRDIKSFVAEGFTTWTFSWAWAPKHFKLPSGAIVEVGRKVDLVTRAQVAPWAKAFGMEVKR